MVGNVYSIPFSKDVDEEFVLLPFLACFITLQCIECVCIFVTFLTTGEEVYIAEEESTFK